MKKLTSKNRKRAIKGKGESFFKKLNDFLEENKVKQMWGWDTGEIIVVFEDKEKMSTFTYNFNPTMEENIKKVGKIEIWGKKE